MIVLFLFYLLAIIVHSISGIAAFLPRSLYITVDFV